MKKLLLIMFFAIFAAGCTYNLNAKPQNPETPVESQVNNSALNILTLFSSKADANNKVWVGTFQLVFNDMKNEILKLKKVEFVGEKPTDDLVGLNKEEFNSSMLNPETYYKSYGATSPTAKEKIKKDIKKKFNETSDIIDEVDWTEAPGRYYAYAMLKKEFEFLKEFDKLDPQSFNGSDKKYDFFGIKRSSSALNANIRVLFYNSEDDFAVQLLTKNGDEVYLYRTESNDSFDKIYEKMKQEKENYKGSRYFEDIDTFKAPNLSFKSIRRYDELCNKIIKDTDGYYFSAAMETIQFELNSKGGKIKSEAILMADNAAIAFEEMPKPRHFDFDKTFNLFLVDKDKKDPYMALRVKDLSELSK